MLKSHQDSNTPIGIDVGEGKALLLSAEELAELTGTRQPARQRRWLEARGWPYAQALGRGAHPRVARFVFAEKMRAKDREAPSVQPRFDALNRLGSLQ